MTSLPDLTARLCRISRTHFIDPFSRLEWPESLERAQWFMTPELISLHGTKHYEALDENRQQLLSFYELVNFFSINIHGERMLIEGLAKRLYRKHTEVVSPYLHHFLDEENKHMFYFGRFCNQYAGKVYAEKKFAVDREYAEGEEEFLFFARVMVFEEMVDIYNRRMAKDERLVPIAREINWLHHFEEARHLAFGRRIVEELFDSHADAWHGEVRQRIADELLQFFEATWKDFFNPDAYRDAGLHDTHALRRELLADEAVGAKCTAYRERCARTLYKIGLLNREKMQ
jgi:P-aminobenzoate N-oxygenase AurF